MHLMKLFISVLLLIAVILTTPLRAPPPKPSKPTHSLLVDSGYFPLYSQLTAQLGSIPMEGCTWAVKLGTTQQRKNIQVETILLRKRVYYYYLEVFNTHPKGESSRKMYQLMTSNRLNFNALPTVKVVHQSLGENTNDYPAIDGPEPIFYHRWNSKNQTWTSVSCPPTGTLYKLDENKHVTSIKEFFAQARKLLPNKQVKQSR